MSFTDTLPSPAVASPLAPATETGALGVYQLKRLWSRTMAGRQGRFPPTTLHDRHLDNLVVHAVGLGLEQTAAYLGQAAPSFEAFERWIVATTGGIDPEPRGAHQRRGHRRRHTAGEPARARGHRGRRARAERCRSRVLGGARLRRAARRRSAGTREAAAQALWQHLGANPDDPETWYRRTDHGIMVQYFQHPAFTAIRRSPRIHKAFAQLWGTADLWATTDRVGFNPPERDGFMFPGPHLHWDVSVKTPIPFGTAGILYLADTPPEQGAFTLVPGFQRWGEAWLKALPPGAHPRQQNLYALGPQADRRTRRRSDRLASGAAARRQPQPRRQAAARSIHQHVPDADRGTGGVDLSH